MKKQCLTLFVAVLLGFFSMLQIASADNIFIDDQNSGFERHGTYWWTKNVGQGNKMQFTYANGNILECWGQWNFSIPSAGVYEVQAYIPRDGATSKKAKYQICYDGQELCSVTIDQAVYFDEWISLGIYYFKQGIGQNVRLDDNTGEPATAKFMIGYDAVKLIPQDRLLVQAQTSDKIYWLQNNRRHQITSLDRLNAMKTIAGWEHT